MSSTPTQCRQGSDSIRLCRSVCKVLQGLAPFFNPGSNPALAIWTAQSTETQTVEPKSSGGWSPTPPQKKRLHLFQHGLEVRVPATSPPLFAKLIEPFTPGTPIARSKPNAMQGSLPQQNKTLKAEPKTKVAWSSPTAGRGSFGGEKLQLPVVTNLGGATCIAPNYYRA